MRLPGWWVMGANSTARGRPCGVTVVYNAKIAKGPRSQSGDSTKAPHASRDSLCDLGDAVTPFPPLLRSSVLNPLPRQLRHSYRSASIGSILAARSAGRNELT